MIKSVFIEGVDRLGKDTLIKGILDRHGFFQVVHYQKPALLKYYVEMMSDELLKRKQKAIFEEIKKRALHAYQAESFMNMFTMAASQGRFIFNRAHLGETVYAPRYRGYDGSYVFEIEDGYENVRDSPLDTSLLVVLYTSDFSFISDDGNSFDVGQREAEQDDFLSAFERSKIKHKLVINVCNRDGGFISFEEVLEQVSKKLC